MVRLLTIAAVMQAAAAQDCDGGSCATEEASLIQVRGRGRGLVGAYARAAEAIRNVDEGAADICTKAETGDVAPVAGLFEMDGDDAFAVEAGYTAPKPGVFCVPKETMALVARAHGFESHQAIEAALMKKEGPTNPWGAEGVFAGKYSPRTTCPEVPLECKMSVYPMRHELCTILWTMQNQWLANLPGCNQDINGESVNGSIVRRNIEGACHRDWGLKHTCPLTCEDTIELGKKMETNLQTSYVCWAGGCNNTVTSGGVNDYIKTTIVGFMSNLPEMLTKILKPEEDTYPCDENATAQLCETHCPTTCQMLLDAAVAAGTGTAAELCAGSCAGSHEATATNWNQEMSSSLSTVQGILSLEAQVSPVCTAALVQSVCAQHCA